MTDAARPTTSESAEGVRGFDEAWLNMTGMERDELRGRAEGARRRSRRYPWYVRFVRAVVVTLLQWIGPLVCLGRFSRASSLESASFETMMRSVREHHWPAVRMAGLAAVAPLMEVVSEDEPPLQTEHPLEARLEAHSPTPDGRYDVVVIGSGAGGAPVAARLAEQGAAVAIVEKGGLVEACDTSEALERHYVNQGLMGVVRGTPLLVMAGESLGGTTSVNSGTSLRPSPERLAQWADHHVPDFPADSFDTWLDRAEEAIHVTVPPAELRSTSAERVAEGFEALGRENWYPLPRSVDGCRGSGRCCFGCPTGAKQSTDRAFLPRALDAGADLYADSEATRIDEHGGGVSVEVETPDGAEVLEAERLVVAAGALRTPGLLRGNRLGEGWREAGPGFKTHPATKVFAHFSDARRPEEFPGIPQGVGYKPPEIERVTMEGAEVPATAVGPVLPAGGGRFAKWLGRHDRLASYGAMVRDRNTGRVREFGGQPLVSYDLHPDDARDLARAMELIARAFFAAGAESVLLPWPALENEFASVEELDVIDPTEVPPDQLLMSGFHPQGTAGMGRVVDADLQLEGSDRIYVCDASVLPDSPGVNPQVTIIALSLRLADHLS